jgi:ribosome-binding factor A
MSKRVKQVADTIQQVLGEVIQKELKDPRIGFATVTAVQVSVDLRYARVFISVMGNDEQQKETMQGLKSARGYMRQRVASEMNHLRFVPELRLELDTSLDYSLHIESLLHKVERERLERDENEYDC